MQHYKIIVLVIATTGGVYDEFRKIYSKYSDTNNHIKVLFAYGKPSIGDHQYSSKDLVFDTIEDNYYPGMLKKTLYALKHINNTYSYDFLVRTNLSTFWVFDKLLQRVSSLPTTNVVSGTFRKAVDNFGRQLPEYISGTGIVLSRDMVDVLVSDKTILDTEYPEDFAISNCFVTKGIRLTRAVPRPICLLEQNRAINPSDIEKLLELNTSTNIDHYRIKSSVDLRHQDIHIANKLLNFYYGKTL